MKRKLKKWVVAAVVRLGLGELVLRVCRMLEKNITALPSKEKLGVWGGFVDAKGHRLDLLTGFRDLIKPGWEAMLRPDSAALSLPSQEYARLRFRMWHGNLDGVEQLLQKVSGSLKGQDILEVGAHDGATAYALAGYGARSVCATDKASYYLTQAPGKDPEARELEAVNRSLGQIREVYARFLDPDRAQRVRFADDDITASALPPAAFDLLLSWELLEHVTQPAAAFAAMARVLRPGGIAFHDYNPFFALNGGHSLCTLDFPWGHARLSGEDFERYIKELRPNEVERALTFYRNGLNRMTLRGVENYAREAGLTPLAILPQSSPSHLDLLDADAFAQCKAVYPDVEVLDLISPAVILVLQKPL